MRKVHLISVTEPLVLDLALALREKGYEVSASGCGLTEEMIGRLHNAGCTCYGDGWFPEKLIKEFLDPEANIIFGTIVDERIHDAIMVTVIATGIEENADAKVIKYNI